MTADGQYSPLDGASDAAAVQLAVLSAEIRALRIEWATSHRHLTERVDDLESWQTWITRLVMSLIITAIITGGIAVAGWTALQ